MDILTNFINTIAEPYMTTYKEVNTALGYNDVRICHEFGDTIAIDFQVNSPVGFVSIWKDLTDEDQNKLSEILFELTFSNAEALSYDGLQAEDDYKTEP